MSKHPIKTRNWSAVIKSDNIAGANTHIEVCGEVETSRSNQRAKLSKANPQGINQKILLLDLEIVTEGEIGNDVMGWTKAEYKHSAHNGEFSEVEIRAGGSDVAKVKVENQVS